MPLQVLKRPANVCFTADGVEYVIVDSGSHEPKLFTFRLQVLDKNTSDNYITKDIDILSIPNENEQLGEDDSIHIINLTDIVQAYTNELFVDREDAISGYTKIQLTSVQGIGVSDTVHICLPGSSGGLVNIGILPTNIHPFLVTRGNEEGALHFYRSELLEMAYIYAFIPDSYETFHIETDNKHGSDIPELDKLVRLNGCNNLFGICLVSDFRNPYKIWEDANALYLYYHHSNELQINTIAIVEDPDTDDAIMLKWINSMGVTETLLLSGEMRDISEIDNPDLYITRQTPKETRRLYLRRNVTTKYSLQTGYLTSARICALKDMLTSNSVYIKIDGEWIQVFVTADTTHAIHQREPENFELTIEVLTQTKYYKPNRTINPLPTCRNMLLQDNQGNMILDNNSNSIQENG